MRGTLTAGQTLTFAIPTIPTGSARTGKDISDTPKLTTCRADAGLGVDAGRVDRAHVIHQ
jgi:hypothetical protein